MSDLSLEKLGRMEREWHAWTAIVLQLKNASASIDINEEPQLHAAILLWGEQLAILRASQQPEHRAAGLEKAEKLYAEHIGFLPYEFGGESVASL